MTIGDPERKRTEALDSSEKKAYVDDALKAMKPGDFLVFKPKTSYVRITCQHYFQKRWFAQTRGHESATHVAMCVENKNGEIDIVHVTSQGGCIQETLQKTKWNTDKWNIISFRLKPIEREGKEEKEEEKSIDLAEKLAKEAKKIAARKQDRPYWSFLMGLKAIFRFGWLNAARTPKSGHQTIAKRTICSSLMIQICKKVIQKQNKKWIKKVGESKRSKNGWDPNFRARYPDLPTACFPDNFEAWLDKNPTVFSKDTFLGRKNVGKENEKIISIYAEADAAVKTELERIKKAELKCITFRSKGKYNRVIAVYERVQAILKTKKEFTERDKALYFLKALSPALQEKVNFTVFPRTVATSYKIVMEKVGDLGISRRDIERYQYKEKQPIFTGPTYSA
jgi:hypothetical protein